MLSYKQFLKYNQMKRLLNESKRHLPTNNQIEINPFFNNDSLVKLCQKNGVVVTAYSPLGNPSAPPTRQWDEKHVPLIKGQWSKIRLFQPIASCCAKLTHFGLCEETARDCEIVECRGQCQKVGPRLFYHTLKLKHLSNHTYSHN